MPKLTTFVIVMLAFIILLAGAFTPLMAEINANYDVLQYNKTSLEAYDKLSDLNEDIESTKTSATTLESESGVLDVLGGFFEAGYGAIKVAAGSFQVFDEISEQAFADINIPVSSDIFKAGLIGMAVITIFFGIIIGAIIKRDI